MLPAIATRNVPSRTSGYGTAGLLLLAGSLMLSSTGPANAFMQTTAVCGGDHVVIAGEIFASGSFLDCEATTSITTEGTVQVQAGAQVYLSARTVTLGPGFTAVSGASFHAGTTVSPGGGNAAPSADAGGPYSGTLGSTIAVSGAGSNDSDGSIASYAWDLDDDGQYDDASGVDAQFSADSVGTFTIALRVTDDEGATASDSTTVTVSDSGSGTGAPYAGYNLYGPLGSTTAYLMDNEGTVVHSWSTGYQPGHAMYLLESGELLHTGDVGSTSFDAGGAGGIVQTFDWDGNVTWSYEYANTQHLQHHDVEWLPNGNVLLIAWQNKSESEALAAGRNPTLLKDGELWPDSVIEVKPTGGNTGEIVWEWHVWDHLVQDYDASKDNYGVVADHPELVDLNYTYKGGGADWTHINAIDYHAELDQILLTVRNFSEIWVIDHSTTAAEAAGHSGGNSGKGGDLLYRWGNPQTYDAGTGDDQQLFVPHDGEWISAAYPGADNILIFNNGGGRSDGDYSSVDEVVPPMDGAGNYSLTSGSAYAPTAPTWSYTAGTPSDFYATNISGAQRLPNGNTLICEGPDGYFFEVTEAGELVWDHTASGAVFRVERYGTDYAGFDGTPLDDGSQAPSAEAGGPYTGQAGTLVSLDGSGSSDADGWIAAYAWDLDEDGAYDDASEATAQFSAATAGSYTIALKVTDNDGLTDTATTTVTVSDGAATAITYPIVDTGQTTCYSSNGTAQACTGSGYDADYTGNAPSYSTGNGGSTVYDNVTGLTWTASPDTDGDGDADAADKLSQSAATGYCSTLSLGGYAWRLPDIKELYSLILFSGTDPSGYTGSDTSALTPFIDDSVFVPGFGDTAAGERIIDGQYATSTIYVSPEGTLGGATTMFGVNFIDGRIKGYPAESVGSGPEKTYYVLCVSGGSDYGVNDFLDNGDGTVSDRATGLMWEQGDTAGLTFEEAVAHCEAVTTGGHFDWRLPDVKELQGILDYTRAPDATAGPALDPVFDATAITNEGGATDWGYYWSSTTHVNYLGHGNNGSYVSFGRALGYYNSQLVDVHGAGAQRSNDKTNVTGGQAQSIDLGYGLFYYSGPQGDVLRSDNMVRCVRSEAGG